MANPNANQPGYSKRKKNYPPKNNRPKQPNNWFFWIALGFVFLIMLSQTKPMNPITGEKELSYS